MPDNAHSRSSTSVREFNPVGVAGCGRMGTAGAYHLLDEGRPVVVADPVWIARAQVVSRATEARSQAELAQVNDLVLVAVVDDVPVKDVLSGPRRTTDLGPAGTVVALMEELTIAESLSELR